MEPVTKNLPVIAMRGLNVFPRMNTSFDLERPISVHALERAMENGEEIFLVTQREIGVEQPEEKDLYEIGTVARVTQILRVSDRVLRVMMEGACRARLKRLWQREPFLQAQVELIDEPATSCHSKRTEALLRQTYASVTMSTPPFYRRTIPAISLTLSPSSSTCAIRTNRISSTSCARCRDCSA